MQFDATFGALVTCAGAADALPDGEIVFMQRLETIEGGFVGRALPAGAFCFGSLPVIQYGFDIAFEYFTQVMLAVKLVFVTDANIGAGGIAAGHVLVSAHQYADDLHIGVLLGGHGVFHPFNILVEYAVDFFAALRLAALFDAVCLF